jgi:hypothetical protein
MQSGAASFVASLPPVFNPGGTPTDEAFRLFHEELSRTQIGNRMQVAVLVTDGIPTLCNTTDGKCTGRATSANLLRSADAAITERFSPTRLPALGSLVFTVGIGASVADTTDTTKYGVITGSTFLRNLASSPRFAFSAADFNYLVTTTTQEVLDLLCFYVIDVDQPKRQACSSSGTMFVIRGYNVFEMGSPKCRWQQVGTSNYLFTNATINVTSEKFETEPGIVGYVMCPAPPVPSDPYNAYLEISRDGTYYTSNQFSVLLRNDCRAPPPPAPCPSASIAALFDACKASDFVSTCSAGCEAVSNIFGYAWKAQSIYPDFTAQQIKDCITNQPSSLTLDDKLLISSRSGPGKGPCTSPTPAPATNGASTPMASLMLALCFVLA